MPHVTKTHCHIKIFLFQLLDESSLPLDLMVCVMFVLLRHEHIVKCLLNGLKKTIKLNYVEQENSNGLVKIIHTVNVIYNV